MIRRFSGLLCLIFAATLAIAAASSSHWQHVPAKDREQANPFAGSPQAAAAGALVYRDHCMQCHKTDAMGDGRKKPALRSESIRSASDGDLEWFLRQGDLRRGMPSWSSLPKAQRWQVIAYLRSIQ